MDPVTTITNKRQYDTTTDWQNCMLCQTTQPCTLSKLGKQGLEKVQHAIKLRFEYRDLSSLQIIERLQAVNLSEI